MKLITLENENIDPYSNEIIGLGNDKVMKWGNKMRIEGESGVKVNVNLAALQLHKDNHDLS